jgi:hypothetical protein
MSCHEWYATKPRSEQTGHQRGMSLGRLNTMSAGATVGKAFHTMARRSNIGWVMRFEAGPDTVMKSSEVWDQIVENGLILGKWTSLHERPLRNSAFVVIGFEKEASAIIFKMLWPELIIRRNI